MRIYIAGPMRGYKDFNFPAFMVAEEIVRENGAEEVFNPARRDLEAHGAEAFESETGDLADIAHLGFDLREALGADTEWICRTATAIYMLDGWENSSGARAEKALAEALGHTVLYQTADRVARTPAETSAFNQGEAMGYQRGWEDGYDEAMV